MPTRVKLEIPEKDRETLTRWAASGLTEQRLGRRAKSILMGGEGNTVAEIAAGAGLSRMVVSKWRERYRERGP